MLAESRVTAFDTTMFFAPLFTSAASCEESILLATSSARETGREYSSPSSGIRIDWLQFGHLPRLPAKKFLTCIGSLQWWQRNFSPIVQFNSRRVLEKRKRLPVSVVAIGARRSNLCNCLASSISVVRFNRLSNSDGISKHLVGVGAIVGVVGICHAFFI